MELKYKTSNVPMLFTFTVSTDVPTIVRIQALDESKPNTVYLDRYATVKGKETFYVRLPISAKETTFKIFDNKNPNSKSIKLIDKKVENLKLQLQGLKNKDKYLRAFIPFAMQFCERAGYTSPGIYLDDDGLFVLKYSAAIVGDSGDVKNTPARINASTHVMEISRAKFIGYTVAGRIAIFCHEFSHIFRNSNSHDEEEADFNAAAIYLSLGFPRVELLTVFAKVFNGAATEENAERLEKLKQFVMNFDRKMLNLTQR